MENKKKIEFTLETLPHSKRTPEELEEMKKGIQEIVDNFVKYLTENNIDKPNSL